MNTDHEQRVKPDDGPHHPRLPDGALDVLEESHEGGRTLLYDPEQVPGDAWVSADPEWVYEIGVDRRDG